GRPLRRRERRQRPDYRLALLHRGKLVRIGRRPGCSAQGHPQPAPPAPEQVQRRAVQVPRGVVELPDPIPPLEQLEERVLHELLGLVPVAAQEPQGSVQAAMLSLEELLERPGLHRARPSLGPDLHGGDGLFHRGHERSGWGDPFTPPGRTQAPGTCRWRKSMMTRCWRTSSSTSNEPWPVAKVYTS